MKASGRIVLPVIDEAENLRRSIYTGGPSAGLIKLIHAHTMVERDGKRWFYWHHIGHGGGWERLKYQESFKRLNRIIDAYREVKA